MSSSLFLDPKHGHAGEVGGGVTEVLLWWHRLVCPGRVRSWQGSGCILGHCRQWSVWTWNRNSDLSVECLLEDMPPVHSAWLLFLCPLLYGGCSTHPCF